MKVLIAADKFKGSLSASQVCNSIKQGLLEAQPNLELVTHPLADGGEGSLDILSQHLKLEKVSLDVSDPLGRRVDAHYYRSKDTAFVEMALASGFELLKDDERDPLKTTTIGTGELIAHAINSGIRNIFLFIGGSATNDAAMGIAQALGANFLDADGNELLPIGESLSSLAHIDISSLQSGVADTEFTILCDVNNPFYGKNGAAYVYAPQKGASPEIVRELDMGLQNFAACVERQFNTNIQELQGAGAAGGIGGGMYALFGAELKSGIEVILDVTDFNSKIQSCDIVITGEGRLDSQSLQGKVIGTLMDLAKEYSKEMAVVVGAKKLNKEELLLFKNIPIYSVIDIAQDVDDAMKNGAVYLKKIGSRILNII